MARALTIVLLLVLTALVAGGVAYWLKPSTNVNVAVTIEQIRNIAQLATVEYTMSALAEQTYQSRFLPKALDVLGAKTTSDCFIVYCAGTVRGSVDLEDVTIDTQETADGPHVSIHFKRGSVLVSDVEMQDLFTISCRAKLERRLSVLQGVSDGQRDAMVKGALATIRKKAIEKGIVEKTMKNAKTFLGEFIGSLGYGVTVTFDEKAYDPSASKK